MMCLAGLGNGNREKYEGMRRGKERGKKMEEGRDRGKVGVRNEEPDRGRTCRAAGREGERGREVGVRHERQRGGSEEGQRVGMRYKRQDRRRTCEGIRKRKGRKGGQRQGGREGEKTERREDILRGRENVEMLYLRFQCVFQSLCYALLLLFST